jgi:hypothetical protein
VSNKLPPCDHDWCPATGCLLLDEEDAYARGHAAGKREGIEAAAKIPGLSTVMITNIRALLQTEAQAPRKEGT